MSLSSMNVFFADAAPTGQTQLSPTGQSLQFMLLMGGTMVVLYFIMLRPQQKRQKEHLLKIQSVKAGDKIVTTGGVIGVVLTVKEKTLTIRSTDTKLEITKAAIGEITERGEATES